MAVTLLGFSKGGAVLNQLLAEMAHVNDPAMSGADPAQVRALVHSVHAVHYLVSVYALETLSSIWFYSSYHLIGCKN
jgi:hypothetical protein